MKKTILKKVTLAVLALVTWSSCNEDILDIKDENAYAYDTYFNTPSEIEKGVIGAYSSFYFNNMYGFKFPQWFDAMANELEPTPAMAANQSDIMALYKYQHNNTTDPIIGYWRMLYKMIMRSNLVIDKAGQFIANNAGDPNADPDGIVTRSLGEAYFLRGWAYSQLAFHYGRVPLRLQYNQAGVEDAPRTSTVEEVWAVAEGDLIEAKSLLPEVSAYAGNPLLMGRASKGSAIGFLGKLYLYTKQYDKANAEFASLTGKYSLLPVNQWMDNFGEDNENNSESVFEIQFEWFDGNFLWGNFTGTPEGYGAPSTQNAHVQLYTWGGVGGWENTKYQPMRVNDYQYKNEANVDIIDPRSALTFYGGIGDNTILDNSTDGPQPYDFANLNYWYKKSTNLENETSNFLQSSVNVRLMRYADVLLMQAECKLETGDLPGAMALINAVRTRAGVFTYANTYTKDQTFELLKRERQLEFMGEQIRYGDLKRWGILKETINPELQILFGIQPVQDKHDLFPIPQLEIDTNLGLGTIDNNWN